MDTKSYGFLALALAAIAGLWWSASRGAPSAEPAPPANVEASDVSRWTTDARAAADVGEAVLMTVYKSPACGCCDGWIEHLRAHGFDVDVEETADMGAVKRRLGVARNLTSCHTGVVAGWVVEGHVPADAIRRFLDGDAPPDAVGLAVPGMPVGSPGMEVEGRPAMRYDVLAFHADGTSEVFERR